MFYIDYMAASLPRSNLLSREHLYWLGDVGPQYRASFRHSRSEDSLLGTDERERCIERREVWSGYRSAGGGDRIQENSRLGKGDMRALSVYERPCAPHITTAV